MVTSNNLFDLEKLEIESGKDNEVKRILELINVPHKQQDTKSIIVGEFAQSLAASLGFSDADGKLRKPDEVLAIYKNEHADALAMVNALAPFKLMKRSTFIGARIGRPEKAKERLMKPSPNVLFPISTFGGMGRNVSSAYASDSRKFGKNTFKVEMARYICDNCGAQLEGPYCYKCNKHASINKLCAKCNLMQRNDKCERCGSDTIAYAEKEINIVNIVAHATAKLGGVKMPKMVKGVKGVFNRCKIVEPLEKGILRAIYNVYIFKDGTARFDATDAPLTHFYPKEMGVSFEKLRGLGYDKDYYGSELVSDDQLVEMKHQDVILNKRGAEYLLSISKYVDHMLRSLYGLEPYYNMSTPQDMIGKLVLTLAPHTSCAVLNRVVGFTDATVGFAHPYTICARRRNADGDEDTTMLLLDALINFSKDYLPTNIGGTMDEPLLLTTRVFPEEVDDEVHSMEIAESFSLEFYLKTLEIVSPSEVQVELVESRLRKPNAFRDLRFTHGSSATAIKFAPKRSTYTQLKTMSEKIDVEFELMDMLASIDKRDAARRLIMSHFMRDMIGNLHSYSKQRFRCGSCNAKFRRVPLSGKCTKDGGKLLLTIAKGSIEKYLNTATKLADRYNLDTYTKQRIMLVRNEIDNLFGSLDINVEENRGQFNLANFL